MGPTIHETLVLMNGGGNAETHGERDSIGGPPD